MGINFRLTLTGDYIRCKNWP